MGRMSAQFFGQELIPNLNGKEVNDIWLKMGLIKNDNGRFVLTEYGKEMGGGLSWGSVSVPTFDSERIKEDVEQFIEHNKK